MIKVSSRVWFMDTSLGLSAQKKKPLFFVLFLFYVKVILSAIIEL